MCKEILYAASFFYHSIGFIAVRQDRKSHKKAPRNVAESTKHRYRSKGLSYAPLRDAGDFLPAMQKSSLLQPIFFPPQYDNRPFVINHDDLSSSNILVDDDYNTLRVPEDSYRKLFTTIHPA
ncbi:hypothetical protein CPB84DRAFT_1762788 [Gymnopilus junonius]|uniref:Uncharacterized protein n=1 Tax=Gymnopilus junonius TaxID=109634 RepID=A0A9P5TTG9_GYMJU|nr:hypothetical protein CPB84DRAFT_1762788 [Gymnopilus junonius]